MTVFLEKIDTAPLQDGDFSFEFYSWISVLIDTLNETFAELENLFNNGLIFPSFTQAEIIALSANAVDGQGWYCSDSTPPAIVFKINGSLVKVTTTPFP